MRASDLGLLVCFAVLVFLAAYVVTERRPGDPPVFPELDASEGERGP
jgi:hypothetical protein